MGKAEDQLMAWLQDAHATEEQAEAMLKATVSRIGNYPALKARTEQHLEETRRHAALIRGCIERRGGTTSALKDAGARMAGLGQALSGLFVGDEVMKASIASYAFEAMEIASYRVLISTAREVGDQETARVCAQILKEEEAMADWLEENMPVLTRNFLNGERAPDAALRT